MTEDDVPVLGLLLLSDRCVGTVAFVCVCVCVWCARGGWCVTGHAATGVRTEGSCALTINEQLARYLTMVVV